MLQHFYIIPYRLYSWKSVALKLFIVKPSLFPNQQRNDTCVYELRLEIRKGPRSMERLYTRSPAFRLAHFFSLSSCV